MGYNVKNCYCNKKMSFLDTNFELDLAVELHLSTEYITTYCLFYIKNK